MRKEKIISHITHLKEKHRAVDDKIISMESSGFYDDAELNTLKKSRLSLKDEIAEMQKIVIEITK